VQPNSESETEMASAAAAPSPRVFNSCRQRRQQLLLHGMSIQILIHTSLHGYQNTPDNVVYWLIQLTTNL